MVHLIRTSVADITDVYCNTINHGDNDVAFNILNLDGCCSMEWGFFVSFILGSGWRLGWGVETLVRKGIPSYECKAII